MMKRLLACVAALLGSCAWPQSSNWHLMDEGYSINRGNAASDFRVEVHVNQLKELGGNVNSAQFRQFVAERLKRHGMCPSGWEPLPCVEDGTCLARTKRSVTVSGRCTPT